MNKRLLSLLILVLAILMPMKMWVQEPYAVLSDNNTVLTFYYDNKKEIRNGMDIINSLTEDGEFYRILPILDEFLQRNNNGCV